MCLRVLSKLLELSWCCDPFHVAWSYPSLLPMARCCLAMAQAESSWSQHQQDPAVQGTWHVCSWAKPQAEPQKAFGKLLHGYLVTGMHLIPVSNPSFLAYIWQCVAWVMEGCLHPGVQFLVGGHSCPCMWGLFWQMELVVPPVPGIEVILGMLVAHTDGLMRNGDTQLQVQLWIPPFKGSCVDDLLCISVKKFLYCGCFLLGSFSQRITISGTDSEESGFWTSLKPQCSEIQNTCRIWLMTGSSKIPPWLCLYKKRCPLLGLNMVKSFKKLPSPVLPLLHHQCLHLSSSSHRVQLAEVLSTDNILGECMDCIISKNISKETRRYRGDGSTSVTFHGLLFGLGFWKLFSCFVMTAALVCLVFPTWFPLPGSYLCWLEQAAPCAFRFCSSEALNFPLIKRKHSTWHAGSQAFQCLVFLCT